MGGPIVPTDWKRYRDDTFNIEENTEDQILNSFTEYLNSNILENKIKFTMETSSQELFFLDTKVHLKNNYLVPEIYSKSTDSHEYLNPKSCHPPQVTLNIPYSVALRVRTNCSDRDPGDRMFINNMVKYKAYLIESGYESDQIDEHFIKVAKLKRKHTSLNFRSSCSMRAFKSTRLAIATFKDPLIVLSSLSNLCNSLSGDNLSHQVQ